VALTPPTVINTVSPKPQTTFFDTVKSDLDKPLFAVTLKHGAPGSDLTVSKKVVWGLGLTVLMELKARPSRPSLLLSRVSDLHRR
jgi:hypothetical protein